jgi:hypothetical protein
VTDHSLPDKMLLAITIVPRRFFDNSLPEDGKQSRYPVRRPSSFLSFLFLADFGLHKQAAGVASSSSSAGGYNEADSQTSSNPRYIRQDRCVHWIGRCHLLLVRGIRRAQQQE